MSRKRFKEFKSLSQPELLQRVGEIQKGLFQARIQQASGELSDTAITWRLRKDLAYVRTLISAENSQKLARGNG